MNGLIGAPGKQIRLQMPETIEKALNMASVATNAGKKEKATVRDERGTSFRVFTVKAATTIQVVTQKVNPGKVPV